MKRAFPTKLILSLTMALIFCISFGYYDLDEDITNTGVSLQREFSSFGQGIEKIVFMISGNRDDPNNITMQLQGNTIVVDKAFTAGSPTNKMEGLVTDSTIVGGTDNKITTGTANSLAGGQGNKISGSNSVIMGGSGNVINANTGIIMGGQENKITNAKAIIFGSHNEVTGKVSQSTDLENVILGNHIKLTNEGSGENVLMGSGYEFQGEKSFVRSTSGNKLSGSKTVIIDSPNGMIIQTGEAHGSALTMLGNFLLSSKGTGDIDTNETGAVKTITHCNCYNDGTQWYSVQNTAACNLLCDKKVAECGPDVNTCESGDLVNKDQENIKGQFWGCEGTTGSTLITTQCVKCHDHFVMFTGDRGLDCKEEILENQKCSTKNSNGTTIGNDTITQTRSGTLQTFVPSTKAVYKNSNNDPTWGTTCSFTCTGGYYYKNVKDQCEVCPTGTWRANGTDNVCGGCGIMDNGYWILNPNISDKTCAFECNIGYHKNLSTRECDPNQYSIEYELQGGNHGASHPTTAKYNEGFTVSYPTKAGYIFAGWDISNMDNERHYYGDDSTTATSISNTQATSFKNLTAQNNGSINFSAKWTPNWYTVTLVDDNKAYPTSGAVTAGTTQYHYQYQTHSPCYYYTTKHNTSNCLINGEKITPPTRAGYNFQGYYTQKNGQGTKYVTSDGTTINNIYNTIAGNTTLYAYWTPKTIKIHLDPNWGDDTGTKTFYYQYGIYKFYKDNLLKTPLERIKKPGNKDSELVHYYTKDKGPGNNLANERYVEYYSEEEQKNIYFASDLVRDIYEDTTLFAASCHKCNPVDNGSCTLTTISHTLSFECKYKTSCIDGYQIEDNGTYHPSCKPTFCPAIRTVCPQTPNGETCDTYKEEISTNCKSNDNYHKLTCTNGQRQGTALSYKTCRAYKACDGYSHNTTKQFCKSSTVGQGNTCNCKSFTCNDGSRGNSGYPYTSCSCQDGYTTESASYSLSFAGGCQKVGKMSATKSLGYFLSNFYQCDSSTSHPDRDCKAGDYCLINGGSAVNYCSTTSSDMLNTILAELYDKKCREDCVNRTMDFDDCMNDCHKPTSQYISNGGSSSGGGSSGGGGNSTTPPTQEQVSCASKCADDCLKTHPGGSSGMTECVNGCQAHC